MYIQENIKTQIKAEYDVAVCGGGFGGISAALASARQGKKTVLFEKQFMLGGLGTAGIVTIYLPLCDGYGHQVSYGIAEELLRLSISHGAEARYPDNWLDGVGTRGENDKRFCVQYNPQLFAILAEKLLIDEGVDILYGTYAVGVRMNGDKISHIITENKSGRLAYKVGSVVDATGDCDIAKFAGAPTDTFKQGNVLAAWYYSAGKSGYKLNQIGCSDTPEEEKTVQNKKTELLVDRRFTGLDGDELSEQTCLSHLSTFNDFLKKRKDDPEVMPVTIATTPQIRMTRKIVGEYELSDKETHKYFEDSIGMVSDWKKRGPVYEVPFGTLYSARVKNLICAGRCISVNETLWDVMRVIPCCAVTGQAAGTAAAMTDDFTSLSVKELQRILEENGVVLHEKDII
ncbi:MAG: FAD-dependent oxidoreductase [Clostridia bacterium]|nr:FAD-dependent oxidoreductase [Clostridia bacterium]